MSTIFVATVLVALVHLSQQKPESYKISIKQTDLALSTIPVNPIAKQCGGPGKLVQQRNTFCANPDCKGPAPTSDVTLESDFFPSKDIAQLGWRITLTFEGKPPFVDFEGPIPNGTVKGGVAQTFQAIVTPDPMKGSVTAKYEYFDAVDKAVDLCIEAQFVFT